MKNLVARIIPLLFITFAAALTVGSCNKETKGDTYEEWRVHDYCVPAKPSVPCYQDDYDTITLCCKDANRHQAGEKIIVSQDENITYYREFEALIKKYELE